MFLFVFIIVVIFIVVFVIVIFVIIYGWLSSGCFCHHHHMPVDGHPLPVEGDPCVRHDHNLLPAHQTNTQLRCDEFRLACDDDG